MRVVSSIADLCAWRAGLAPAERVGFVPTMGALHDGHLSLLTRARAECTRTLLSVFVNPTQFAPGEDFATYPRDVDGDVAKVRAAGGADLLWFGETSEMYPPGFQTHIEVPALAQALCGRTRPTHFAGVALVVLKLFHLVRPTRAYFGLKDFQQYTLIRRMALDLNLPVEVVGCPIVREPDGLAMSSRNARLGPSARRRAPLLHQALLAARARYLAGEHAAARILLAAQSELESRAGAPPIDLEYLELVSSSTLASIDEANDDARLAIAARLDGVRLIDNLRLGGDDE